MKSGFALVHRSSKSKKQLENNDIMSAYLTLQCQHRLTFASKVKCYEAVFKTKWSRKCDVRCKFRINISLHKKSTCWWVHNAKGPHKNILDNHIGHFKADASHIHTGISLLPKEELILAKQCSQLNMTNSNVAALLNIKSVLGIEINWTKHQIYYQDRLSDKLKELNSNASSATKASSAKKLIGMFEERSDTNFLYLTFKPTEGLLMMTGKHRTKKVCLQQKPKNY